MYKFKIKVLETGEILSILNEGTLPSSYYDDPSSWKDAVALTDRPEITKYQRIQTTFNLTTEPAEVEYNIVDKTIQEYQNELVRIIGNQYVHALSIDLLNQFIDHTLPFDPTSASAIKLDFNKTINQMLLLTTFEDLEMFVNSINPLIGKR